VPAMDESYTDQALKALTEAARTEHDFAGWLAGVLARAAAALGSSGALVAGRPGSWEADLLIRLVRGTAGWDDEYLQIYTRPDATGPADQRTGHP
jgi:hypothetical protein